MNESAVNAIFVYGTLQSGEERAGCWPAKPVRIRSGKIQGEIYDLGDYPALIEGSDSIAGELRELRPEDMALTLEALDQIECYGQGGVDLYERRLITCTLTDGSCLSAFTYYLADPDIARQFARVLPGTDGHCRWHRYR